MLLCCWGCQEYFPELNEVAYATIACVVIYVIAFAVGLGKHGYVSVTF